MADIAQLFAIAVRYQQQQRFEAALAVYEQLLEQCPHHLDALTNRGSVLKRLGRLTEAIACYRQVLELKVDSAPVWFNLGNALQSQGQIEAAIDAFQQAITHQPTLTAAHFNLGKLRQEQGQLELAKVVYQRALELAPNLARIHTNLGNVLKALGQLEAAIACHQQAIQLQPDYAEAYNNLGTALAAVGQVQAARAAYQQALQMRPDLTAAQANLAELRPTQPNSTQPDVTTATHSLPQTSSPNINSRRTTGTNPLTGKVLIAHHWPYRNQRQPLCSPSEIYLTCQDEQHRQVIRIPSGAEFAIKDWLARRLPGWEPDVFIAKVDSFSNLLPRQVEALPCPKVLVLGDTHHGDEPLQRMIAYAQSEAYDLYVTDHNRQHLWYYWLAGLRDLYWLPTLFLNPPMAPRSRSTSPTATVRASQFQGKTVFIGQVGRHHPRRRRLVADLQTLPQFRHEYLPEQQATLAAYAAADMALNISLNGDLNLRTFEILAAGGFLLADQLTEASGIDLLLEAGSDYETFADAEELLAKIAHFTQHPEQIRAYRQRGHERYRREYRPSQMMALLAQLLQGKTISDRFTHQSLKRIQFSEDTTFSTARIRLYEIVQALHRQQKHLSVLLDATLSLTSLVDFLDLPRLNLTLTQYDQAYLDRLQPYLVQSGNQQRVQFVPEVQSYQGFNVIITATCNAQLLAKVSAVGVVLISTDYAGLEDITAYCEFQPTIATQVDFDGQFFQLTRRADRQPSQIPNPEAQPCRASDSQQLANSTRSELSDRDQNSPSQPMKSAAQLEAFVGGLRSQGKYREAIAHLRNHLSHHAEDALAWGLLGALHCQLTQIPKAVEALQKAVQYDAHQAGAWINLGHAYTYQGKLGAAIASCQQALKITPNSPAAYLNLGFALNNQGRVPEAIAAFRQSLQLKPNFHFAASHLLYSMNYVDTHSPEAVAQAHRHWGQQYRTTTLPPKPGLDRNPHRRLRVGYVSPDFRRHAIAYFMEPVLAHRDATQIETVCYASVAAPDDVTARLRQLADHWHNVFALNDAQLASLIHNDNIDILVDLTGHTAGNCLGAFASRPAPIQVTYMGYPNTTGLDTMDYRLTDAWADPVEGGDRYYTEELIRLPDCFLCYQPPHEAPAVTELPALTTGQITFGSFNNLPKLTPTVIELWATILKAVPDSRIVLKTRWFDDAATRDRVHTLFADSGIDRQRVQLVGLIPDLREHLAYYRHIDIALDPFPYNGTTTTCEVLWMGAPVVTLVGQTHAGRVGVSLLNTVGRLDLIATTHEDYVAKAVALAADLPRLRQLRANLRQQVAESSLCDGIGHGRSLEAAYRTLWRQYCQSVEPQ